MEIAVAAIATNLVTIVELDDQERVTGVATGFLVDVGGRTFVFTAGHVVGGETDPDREARPFKLMIQFYRRDIHLLAYPDRHIARVDWANAKATRDVGALELNPDSRSYWSQARPFNTADLVEPFAAGTRRDEDLVLVGLPAEFMREGAPHPGVKKAIVNEAIVVQADNVEVGPRGLSVTYEAGRSVDRFDSRTGLPAKPLPQPQGISGGPLMLLDRETHNARVLGIARGYLDERQYFEPIHHALELLIDHPTPEVAADARLALTRIQEAYARIAAARAKPDLAV